MAYTNASRTQPNDTQTGPNFATSALANDRAAIDAIVLGFAQGWVYSVSGGTAEQPGVMLWTHTSGAKLRATLTWGASGGSSGNITQAVLEYSANGTDYTTSPGGAIVTVVNTFDASGNLTSTTGGGSFGGFLTYLLGKAKATAASLASHTAGTGTSVHGLGTMSTQNKTLVDIDGGDIADVTLSYQRARGKVVSYGSISGAGTIDWAAGDTHVFTLGGILSLSWSNLPPANYAQGLTMVITNPGAFSLTWPAGVKWPGAAAPSRTVSGVDIYEFFSAGDGVVRGAQAQKASA